MLIIEIIAFVFSIIGMISSVVYLYDRFMPLRRLSWKIAQNAAKNIADRMSKDGFCPTVIVGIGRGGAIMGSLISGCLGHRPLLVIDRKYNWIQGRRTENMILQLSLPKSLLENTLLVAGETHTGNTMHLYYDYFKKIGAKNIRRAVLYWQFGCIEPIEYIGLKGKNDLLMPWMFIKEYTRDSRSIEEANNQILININESIKH